MEEVKTLDQRAASENRKPQGGKKRKKWKPVQWLCFALALIPLLGFLLFSGFPAVLSFISMFVDINKNDLSTMTWNNFENIKLVFTDVRFWKSWRTTFWLGSCQLVTLCIALVIAVLLDRNKSKFSTVGQIINFIPYICSSAAVAIMWSWVFNGSEIGLLNTIFGTNINWLDDKTHPSRLVWCVYITILGQAPAYGIVMFTASLKNVSPSLYEAADLDGANGFHKFWYITLPGIKSVTLFLLLAGITNGLGIFEPVLVLAPVQWTQVAGPNDIGLTVNYYIYIKGIMQREMEYASVIGWIMFVVMFAITYPVIRARNKIAKEEG